MNDFFLSLEDEQSAFPWSRRRATGYGVMNVTGSSSLDDCWMTTVVFGWVLLKVGPTMSIV